MNVYRYRSKSTALNEKCLVDLLSKILKKRSAAFNIFSADIYTDKNTFYHVKSDIWKIKNIKHIANLILNRDHFFILRIKNHGVFFKDDGEVIIHIAENGSGKNVECDHFDVEDCTDLLITSDLYDFAVFGNNT